MDALQSSLEMVRSTAVRNQLSASLFM